MKKYTFFWLTGNSEILEGNTTAQALNNAGYGSGALRALDFYSEGDKTNDYTWEKHKWEKIKKTNS